MNISKDCRGNAQCDSDNPGYYNNNRCLPYSAVILGPDWKLDQHTAVNTDDDQEEDTAEHVDEHSQGGELAHEASKDPLIHRRVGDVEREKDAEDKVRDCEAQVPGSVDRLLHLKASDPDDQSIPKKAQQKNDHTDHQQRHTQDFL